ncbi:MAG: hypothetical protein IRY83_10270 [Chloroflexi bacterium]|nr:hypothetical protein [Chloroflexota bacterium]
MDSERTISDYNQALVSALRSRDPERLRAVAAEWGRRLGNRGLQQLARASRDIIERRMWLMIRDRPDLADLHDEAERWLREHPA